MTPSYIINSLQYLIEPVHGMLIWWILRCVGHLGYLIHKGKNFFLMWNIVWGNSLFSTIKLCRDGVYRRCLHEDRVHSVLYHFHASTYDGLFGSDKTITKVLQVSSFWPTLLKDTRNFVMTCEQCQQTGNISKRHELPQSGTLQVELFYV